MIPSPSAGPFRIAQARDSIQFLINNGYTPLLQALQNPQSQTGSGRINVSAVARTMNTSTTEVRNQLEQVRDLIDG